MFRQCKKNWLSIGLMILAFVSVAFFKINAIIAILICGILGVTLSLMGVSK